MLFYSHLYYQWGDDRPFIIHYQAHIFLLMSDTKS
jgi:hypothetical protein